MIICSPSSHPTRRAHGPQARLVDPVQRVRVLLATHWGVPVSEVGGWRAEEELNRQREALGFSARENGEEVLMWQ